MFDPVRGLSPVIITHDISALFKSWMASKDYFFNLFSKTSNPSKIRSLSASCLWIIFGSMFILFDAIASTLKPLDAYYFSVL